MKKFIYLLFFAIAMLACGHSQTQKDVDNSPSQEEKAELLIKRQLKKTLYKPETYRPVETIVDSAFAPYDDPVFYSDIEKMLKIALDITDLEEEAKHAKSLMSLWNGPYMSEYDKNEYQEAKKEYDELNAKIEKLKAKGRKQYEIVANMLQREREFVGFKAVHNFRADNNAGYTLIGNKIFFIDKNFEEITYSMDVEEFDQMQETISQIKEGIEEGDE